MRELMAIDSSNLYVESFWKTFRVIVGKSHLICDQSPVFHCASSEVRNSKLIWFCTTLSIKRICIIITVVFRVSINYGLWYLSTILSKAFLYDVTWSSNFIEVEFLAVYKFIIEKSNLKNFKPSCNLSSRNRRYRWLWEVVVWDDDS